MRDGESGDDGGEGDGEVRDVASAGAGRGVEEGRGGYRGGVLRDNVG